MCSYLSLQCRYGHPLRLPPGVYQSRCFYGKLCFDISETVSFLFCIVLFVYGFDIHYLSYFALYIRLTATVNHHFVNEIFIFFSLLRKHFIHVRVERVDMYVSMFIHISICKTKQDFKNETTKDQEFNSADLFSSVWHRTNLKGNYARTYVSRFVLPINYARKGHIICLK